MSVRSGPLSYEGVLLTATRLMSAIELIACLLLLIRSSVLAGYFKVSAKFLIIPLNSIVHLPVAYPHSYMCMRTRELYCFMTKRSIKNACRLLRLGQGLCRTFRLFGELPSAASAEASTSLNQAITGHKLAN